MEIIRLTGLIPLLILTVCHSEGQDNALAKNDPPTEWRFNFFTPHALPAVVTFAVILDVDGGTSRFVTLDSAKALHAVVGEWNDRARALNRHWNFVKYPPKQFFSAGTW